MNRNQSFKLIKKFYINILYKNKSLITLIVFNILAIIGFPSILIGFSNDNNKTFNEMSLFILGLPVLLLIIYISLSVIIIFVKTKKNNIDLYLYIKPISNFKINLAKQYAIGLISIHIIAAYFITALILLVFNIPLLTLAISFLGVLLSIILIGFIWISFIILIPTFFKFFTSLTFVYLFTISTILLTTIPFIAENSKILETSYDSTNNKNNFLKIYSLDSNGNTQDTKYAVYSNPLGKKDNIIKGWKPNKIVSYSPFNIFWGITPLITTSLVSKGISKDKLLTTNNKFSITYLETPFNSLDLKTLSDGHITVYGISNKTIFDTIAKNDIFNNIKLELNKSEAIKNKIKDDNFWQTFKAELVKQNIWNINLSAGKKEIILHIAGYKSNNSYLYSIFKDYDLISNKINGIYKYLENKYSRSFSEFVKYIWTSKNVRLNFYSYNTIADNKELERHHPQIMSYDDLTRANKYDIAFIKNKLFNLVTDSRGNIQKIKMLNSSRIYENLSDNNIFSMPIKSKQEFYDYIDQNSTINNLTNFIQHQSTKMTSPPYKMSFRNNVTNYLIINNSIDINESGVIKYSWLYLIILTILAISFQEISRRKLSKGDLL